MELKQGARRAKGAAGGPRGPCASPCGCWTLPISGSQVVATPGALPRTRRRTHPMRRALFLRPNQKAQMRIYIVLLGSRSRTAYSIISMCSAMANCVVASDTSGVRRHKHES
eukprot:scaffold4362_cov106-Isochrysis_galbana.AAC.5